MSPDFAVLESTLGHQFRDHELLNHALTHKSKAFDRGAGEPKCTDNEQLEFLGDSILGFLVSESLVARHPSYPEGRLSKLKAHLVSAVHLYAVALELGLGDYLLLGRGEEMSGGRAKRALLANALEAIIAALYLDGGLAAARAFIEAKIFDGDGTETGEPEPVTDHKSALQEAAQALKLPQPRYVTVGEQGPEHSKTFTVEVRLGRDWVAQAEGLSKKSAGQKAAELMLGKIGPPS